MHIGRKIWTDMNVYFIIFYNKNIPTMFLYFSHGEANDESVNDSNNLVHSMEIQYILNNEPQLIHILYLKKNLKKIFLLIALQL